MDIKDILSVVTYSTAAHSDLKDENGTGYINIISVADKELESSLSFTAGVKHLTKAYSDHPEYFTDDVLVSTYYLVKTGFVEDAFFLASEVRSKMIGRGSFVDISPIEDLIVLNSSFKNASKEEQVKEMADAIKDLLAKEERG